MCERSGRARTPWSSERRGPADGVAVPAEAAAAPAGDVTSAFQTLVSWLRTLIRVLAFHEPHSALFVTAAAAALREHGICMRRAHARGGARGVWYFKAIACFVAGVQHCSTPVKRRQSFRSNPPPVCTDMPFMDMNLEHVNVAEPAVACFHALHLLLVACGAQRSRNDSFVVAPRL